MTYSRMFVKDPHDFAKARAVVPSLGVEDPSRLKAKQVRPDFTLYQVKGANRILFANLVKSSGEDNLYEVELSTTQLASDWFPVYWLPWKQNSTYRITLSPSNKHLTLGLDDRVADPHVFFTAALSGCTVHVDGDPYAPTVYHSNAQAHNVYVPPPMRKNAAQWQMRRKIEHMKYRIELSEQRHAKGSRGRHYEPRAVNTFDYMFYALYPETVRGIEQQAERELGADEGTLTTKMMGGTVFGVRSRSHGLWSFYFQSLTCFRYQKNETWFRTWMVNDCRRFWPGSDIGKPIPIVIAPD